MFVYTVLTCWRCGASYASFWRPGAGVVVFYRVNDLEHAVAEIGPREPMICTLCGHALEVSLPCAVRTADGDWLALDRLQSQQAMAN